MSALGSARTLGSAAMPGAIADGGRISVLWREAASVDLGAQQTSAGRTTP